MGAHPRFRLARAKARRGRPAFPAWNKHRPRRSGARSPKTLRYHWLGLALIGLLTFLWHDGRLNFVSFPAVDLLDAFASLKPNPDIAGGATVIDGDTIEIHGRRIRLYGVDAPEGDQSCQEEDGSHYRCGQRAANALANKIRHQTVACDQRDIDSYARMTAVCRAGDEDINGWLVLQGWAVA